MNIQRFDSAMALNIHFHSLVIDGVYTRAGNVGKLQFHPAPAPTDDEVAAVADRVYRRVAAFVEEAAGHDAGADREPVVAAITAASLRRMIATGLRRELPVRRLGADRFTPPRILGKRQ